MNVPMAHADIARGLRRARLLWWTGSAVLVCGLLPVLLSDGALTAAIEVLFYASLALGTALATYGRMLGAGLRREQGRLDRDEYRRVVSNQRTQ